MKIKLLISSLLMAGAFMGSGTASAIPFTIASGTLSQWAAGTGLTLGSGVTQAVGDITYANHVEATINPSTYLSGDLASSLTGAADYITLAFSEVTPNLYAMIYTFMTTPNPSSLTTVSPFFVNGGGYTTNGGDIEYTLKSLNANLFNAVKLDSTVAINPAVTSTVDKDVYDLSNNVLAALQSISGTPDPLSSFAPFAPSQSIFVRDTYNATGGIIASSQNQFTTIPEPMTLIMLGIGLLGFGYSRRHVLSDVKGLSA